MPPFFPFRLRRGPAPSICDYAFADLGDDVFLTFALFVHLGWALDLVSDLLSADDSVCAGSTITLSKAISAPRMTCDVKSLDGADQRGLLSGFYEAVCCQGLAFFANLWIDLEAVDSPDDLARGVVAHLYEPERGLPRLLLPDVIFRLRRKSRVPKRFDERIERWTKRPIELIFSYRLLWAISENTAVFADWKLNGKKPYVPAPFLDDRVDDVLYCCFEWIGTTDIPSSGF
jgi:hypothetical protein